FSSFPNSCLGTLFCETLFRTAPGPGRRRARNRVSRNSVPKQEFGNEWATPAQLQSWRGGLGTQPAAPARPLRFGERPFLHLTQQPVRNGRLEELPGIDR